MKTKIKICGITRAKDAKKAEDIGVWAIGFIFAKDSKRCVSTSKAKSIITALGKESTTKKVGVFVNESPDRVRSIYDELNLDLVQLHGDEDPSYCQNLGLPYIKVFHDAKDINLLDFSLAYAFLLDAGSQLERGGTGKLSDWSQARKISASYKLILAGGLGPSNIISAIKETSCFAYDLNSCLEVSAGIKNKYKIDELKVEMDKYEK